MGRPVDFVELDVASVEAIVGADVLVSVLEVDSVEGQVNSI